MRKKAPDRMEKLREEIMDAVRLFGLCEVEEMLGIVIMGKRNRTWDKDIKVEIGKDIGEKP